MMSAKKTRGAALFAWLMLSAWSASAVAAPPPGSDELVAGGNLFTISCSSSYCHGPGGAGGRGPSLQNRDFPPDYVRTTVLQGRPGTPMPSFRSTYSDPEIALLIAYVASLSPDSAAGGASDIPAPSNVPLSKQAEAGEDLFFNHAEGPACAACHSDRAMGGPIGPDLVALAAKSPRELYQAMTHPAAGNPAYPLVTVTLKDGRSVAGLQRDDKQGAIRLYDLSSAPPVLRTFAKSDVAKAEPVKDRVPYQHDLSHYSKDDLPDLIAFLKSAAANPPAEVTAADLGSP